MTNLVAPEEAKELSKADLFRSLPAEEQRRRLGLISNEAADALLFDWDFWARPAQRTPQREFITWLVKAGRGFGKTLAGSQQVREWIKTNPIVNLVAATASDIRDVMVEGPSGVLTVCPNGERPLYQPSKKRLVWPNGAISLLFSADEPERLRGPQCYKAWADELAAWRYIDEAWDQLMFGLRLGKNPQVVVTTTPKPLPLIRALIKDKINTVVTSGSTYDNQQNLAANFVKRIIVKYEGTRLGRQELNAELLDDNPNALFRRALIDAARITDRSTVPLAYARVVTAIDPAVSSEEESADTGIVTAARDFQDPPHFYVFEDASCHESPDGWARIAVEQYHKHKADRIVGEVNNGGEMIEACIRHKDENIPYKAVHATRGKVVRAEPISALYEQGRVHHIGSFAHLEDQMCDYVPGISKSPDRMDALVWALTELSDVQVHEEVVVNDFGTSDHQISSDLDEIDL